MMTAGDGFDEPINFDLLVAGLQADSQDVDAFFEVLSTKLAAALGPSLVVERESGLFKRNKGRAQSLSIQLGERNLSLRKDRSRLVCEVSHAVRGIILRSQQVDLPGWLAELVEVLRAEASQSAAARTALESLLT